MPPPIFLWIPRNTATQFPPLKWAAPPVVVTPDGSAVTERISQCAWRAGNYVTSAETLLGSKSSSKTLPSAGCCRNNSNTRNGWRRSDDSPGDRKSTRLNSSHVAISYAVFCLKKKKTDSERGIV